MNLLPRHDFNIVCGHFENIGLLGYPDLPNVDTPQYNIKKSHLLISPIT